MDLRPLYDEVDHASFGLGGGTHRPHVFAMTEALAGRFGPDGVRLVVAFD
ncbi:hypothetical protein ACFV3E_40485 [Streptomyces sp. NPDC059718]